ncbi:MAG: FAD:protein FMN transferase [Candidatus Eisenbacteria bacterium]|nr:FAD:protein FMN transferase [Candidatus Eisenbacteria bacterium]
MAVGRRRLILEVLSFAGALALVIFLMYRARPPTSYEESRVAMGTLVTITVYGANDGAASAAVGSAWREIERVDSLLTRYSRTSEVALLNEAGRAVVDSATATTVARALEIALATEGAFDPTVAPLMDLWKFGEEMALPDHAEIVAALGSVGYARVSADAEGGLVDLGGAQLDLDGIAKGRAVDRAVAALRRGGVESALVDAGGDIGLLGEGPRHGRWRIGIKDPRKEGLLGALKLRAGSVATSGDYQRCGFVDGVRYHHILNPGTGYPARGVLSATVVSDECMVADALATAVFVMGPTRGMSFIESVESVEGVIVSGEEDVENVLISTGLEDAFDAAR